jgi:hypothetical protein
MKMKDKRADEAREREERKQEQKAKKAARRGEEPALDRTVATRAQRPVILIVREGKNTEKHYFEQFRMATHTFAFSGAGTNTRSLVRAASKEQQKGNYEQVWCVFDKDGFPLEDFDNAIHEAQAAGFKVGWSNQAFEYWLLLHFEDHQGGGMDRKLYTDKLNSYLEKLGVHYDGEGSKAITSQLFTILEGLDEQGRPRRALAIARAKRNHKVFLEDRTTPAKSESCTTVYELVEELQKFLPPVPGG